MSNFIEFVLGANTSQLHAEMKRAESGISASVKSINSLLSKIGMGVSFAIIISEAKRVIERFDQIQHRAEQLGISTDALQTFSYGIRSVGGSAEQAMMGMAAFSRRVGEAQNGMGEAIKILDTFGISIRDTNGVALTTAQVFNNVADAIRNAASEQDAILIASRLFGEEVGPRAAEVLREGAAGFAEMAANADAAGQILTEKLVKKLSQASQEIESLTTKATVSFGQVIASIRLAAEGDFAELQRLLFDVTEGVLKMLSRGFIDAPVEAVKMMKSIFVGGFRAIYDIISEYSTRNFNIVLEKLIGFSIEANKVLSSIAPDFLQGTLAANIAKLEAYLVGVNNKVETSANHIANIWDKGISGYIDEAIAKQSDAGAATDWLSRKTDELRDSWFGVNDAVEGANDAISSTAATLAKVDAALRDFFGDLDARAARLSQSMQQAKADVQDTANAVVEASDKVGESAGDQSTAGQGGQQQPSPGGGGSLAPSLLMGDPMRMSIGDIMGQYGYVAKMLDWAFKRRDGEGIIAGKTLRSMQIDRYTKDLQELQKAIVRQAIERNPEYASQLSLLERGSSFGTQSPAMLLSRIEDITSGGRQANTMSRRRPDTQAPSQPQTDDRTVKLLETLVFETKKQTNSIERRQPVVVNNIG